MSEGTLRHFLDEAAGATPSGTRLPAARSVDRLCASMTKVTVIAHSLGAPVSRRALLDAIRNQASWAGKTRVQLFAPAHMGAYLNKVRKELGIASRLIASLTALTKFGVLSLDGLEPGSPFLTQLMEDSSKELANGWDAQVKARQVIFGDGENVVMVQRFLEDPPHTVWPGHGHCSVCRCDKTAPAIASYLA